MLPGCERMDQTPPIRPSLSFGLFNPSIINDSQNIDLYKHHQYRSQDQFLLEFLASVSGRLPYGGVIVNEFPHLDIINEPLNDEQGMSHGFGWIQEFY